jgi:hypothetical protein
MVCSTHVCIYDAIIPLCKDTIAPQQTSRIYRHNAYQNTRRKHQRQYMVSSSAARILRIHSTAKQETRRGDCQHWSWSQERQCENSQCSASLYSWTGTRDARVQCQTITGWRRKLAGRGGRHAWLCVELATEHSARDRMGDRVSHAAAPRRVGSAKWTGLISITRVISTNKREILLRRSGVVIGMQCHPNLDGYSRARTP